MERLRAEQQSRKLAVAGVILGLLPPFLIGPLYLSYRLWIAPQHFFPSLEVFYTLGPEIFVAVVALVCGYRGIKHWPRYPSEESMWFNLSLALGVVWLLIFGVGMEVYLYL